MVLRRRPAVAGMFYEGSKNALIKQIEECFLSRHGPGSLPIGELGEERPPALISPHAGYMYSGPVAAHGFLALTRFRKPDSVIIFGPNHYGVGTIVSIYPEGYWRTPLGDVPIDKKLADEIAASSDLFYVDEESHAREHSIEVQIPFLQYIYREFSFVPICILDQSKDVCTSIGAAVAKVVEGDNVLMIASTDFNHYEPHETTVSKDRLALEKIKAFDVDGMYEAIEKYDVSMCGYGAVAALLTAAKKLNASNVRVLKHATSGDTGGDYSSVVGYASCLIEFG